MFSTMFDKFLMSPDRSLLTSSYIQYVVVITKPLIFKNYKIKVRQTEQQTEPRFALKVQVTF